MALSMDLAPHLAAFGERATLDGVAVRVIFDDAGSVAEGLAVQEPIAQLATASVPTAYRGLALSIVGRGSFVVRDHVPDGTGLSTLVLTRVAA